MTNTQETFLQLARLGIGTSKGTKFPKGICWNDVKKIADEQGLTAIVLDGLDKYHTDNTDIPPLQMKLEWIGEVLQNYEQRYVQYEKAIGNLAGWYNQHGFKMMVLKGYACSLDWPKPNYRPTGDIDIWQFGQWKEADTALAASLKSQDSSFKIDSSHHHHTVFNWQGFTVENHYDFINVHHHKSHVALEKMFKELGDISHTDTTEGTDNSTSKGSKIANVLVNGEKVYLPSPNLHALFLLKHAALHFVGTELTFRQILDWAFFVKNHGKEVDWDMLLPIIEEQGMMPFLNIINAICVGDLGFDAKLFSRNQHLPEIKERVVNEIFASVYDGDKDHNIIWRSISRYRRWKGNEWKHKLCYNESMWSAFLCGVWGHLLKPTTL